MVGMSWENNHSDNVSVSAEGADILKGYEPNFRYINYLLDDARELGLTRVFALTYQPEFFKSMGFDFIEREMLPHKIWGDCLDCPKFPNCDEIAMIRDL